MPVGDVNELIKKIEAALKSPSKSDSRETKFNCLYCYKRDGYIDRKLHLNVNFEKGLVHCFRCGTGKAISSFLLDIGLHVDSVPRSRAKAPPQATLQALPEDLISLSLIVGDEELRAHCFKEEWRYVTHRICLHMWMVPYFAFKQGYVAVLDHATKPTHYWLREIASKHFYMPPGEKPLYFADRASHYSTLILAEGPFDALAWDSGSTRCGIPMIGKSLSPRQLKGLKSLWGVKEICLALDSDVTVVDVAALYKQVKSVYGGRITRVKLQDVDADELSTDDLDEYFSNREDISLSTILRGGGLSNGYSEGS